MMSGDNVRELFELYQEALDVQEKVRALNEKKLAGTISEEEGKLLLELEVELKGLIRIGLCS